MNGSTDGEGPREREREEKQRRVRREEGKEVNGVAFLSSSAPERGERWGAGARGWVASAVGDLLSALTARRSRESRGRTERSRVKGGSSALLIKRAQYISLGLPCFPKLCFLSINFVSRRPRPPGVILLAAHARTHGL